MNGTPAQRAIHAHVDRLGMQAFEADCADGAALLTVASEHLHTLIGPHSHGEGGDPAATPTPTEPARTRSG